MSRAGRLVLAACTLVLVAPWTGWATALAASAPAPPLAQLDADRVEELARAHPDASLGLRLRPGARVDVRFLPGSRSWTVEVRDRGSGTLLAMVEIDDRSSGVLGSFTLPLADYPPRHSEREAIDAAIADSRVRRAAGRWGGLERLRARGSWEGCCWEVDFFAPAREDGSPEDPVLRVDVRDSSLTVTGVWTGLRIPWSMARGDREAFGGDVNERYVWLPLMLLFVLVAVDWRRARSWFSADVAALVLLGVSHELFLQGRVEWSVPLAVPPLLWLATRMAWLFARGLPPQAEPAPARRRLARVALRPVPTRLLVVLCVALAGMRIGLALDGGNVIDVGYAGVAGARLELAGSAPWGGMPDDNPRGDTYGPANYLAYVPATALLDDAGADEWGEPLPAAQATAIAADLACALLLALVGWRWISRRAGVLLTAGWLACPWTTWALASAVNDALVACVLLAAFALLRRPAARGALLGVAAMVKFAPIVALAPMLHAGSRRRLRQALLTVGGAVGAIAAGLAWVVFRLDRDPLADLHLFWERTVGFQLGRGSPFSVWGLYGWDRPQLAAQALVAALLLAACALPRARDAWQVAAGIAAALIAVQLVATHWFYLYVPWFVGFVLLVLVAARERPAACARADMLAACASPSEPPSSPPTGPAWAPSSRSSSRPGSTTSTGT